MNALPGKFGTLANTQVGQFLGNEDLVLTRLVQLLGNFELASAKGYELWGTASQNYALNASDRALLITHSPDELSILNRIELPKLFERGFIVNGSYIDPSNG